MRQGRVEKAKKQIDQDAETLFDESLEYVPVTMICDTSMVKTVSTCGGLFFSSVYLFMFLKLFFSLFSTLHLWHRLFGCVLLAMQLLIFFWRL